MVFCNPLLPFLHLQPPSPSLSLRAHARVKDQNPFTQKKGKKAKAGLGESTRMNQLEGAELPPESESLNPAYVPMSCVLHFCIYIFFLFVVCEQFL